MDANAIAQRDAAISKWLDRKEALDAIKPQELEARNEVTAILFPNPTKGTNRFHLNAGYSIKLVAGTNYTLGDKDLADPETGEKIPVADQVANVLSQIVNLGNRGGEIAKELVKWKPELNEKAYLELFPGDETEAKAKELIDSILTTKPATPQLTFEVPKEKK